MLLKTSLTTSRNHLFAKQTILITDYGQRKVRSSELGVRSKKTGLDDNGLQIFPEIVNSRDDGNP